MPTSSASERAAVLLLCGAALCWYIASRTASECLARSAPSPGRRAVGHWIPVLATCAVALCLGRAEIAVTLIFATSVACLTLGLGSVMIAAETPLMAGDAHRLWGFVLPVALIAWMIGFSGRVATGTAMALLIEGIVLLLIRDRYAVPAEAEPSDAGSSRWRIVLLVLAVLLAITGGVAGTRAAIDLGSRLRIPATGLVTALMLSPAMVLPIMGAGSRLAQQHRLREAVTTQVTFVLLNLCLALPLVAIAWQARPLLGGTAQAAHVSAPTTAPTTQAATQPLAEAVLPYPLVAWRVDTVLLIALGLFLLPLSAGRWSIGRVEGVILIASYAAYMTLTTLAARS